MEEILARFEAICARGDASAVLGYVPAKLVADLYSTFGLHPGDLAGRIMSLGLRMDWLGLEAELRFTCGMSESASRSLVEESKFMFREQGKFARNVQ